jgi:RNA-binding protein
VLLRRRARTVRDVLVHPRLAEAMLLSGLVEGRLHGGGAEGLEVTLTRMPRPEPPQRARLRARAHHLDPVVAIGQHGAHAGGAARDRRRRVTAHELIKVRVHGDDRDARASSASGRESRAAHRCSAVQHLGKLLVLWRPNPDKAAEQENARGSRVRASPRNPKRAAPTPRVGANRPRAFPAPVCRVAGARARNRYLNSATRVPNVARPRNRGAG